MKARIKLDENVFEKNSSNSITLTEEGEITYLNVKIAISASEIADKSPDENVNEIIKANYRDKKIEGGESLDLLSSAGKENGVIRFTKIDSSGQNRSTKLSIVLEANPKVPWTTG